MLQIIEIDIKEFEDRIYEQYIKLFPPEEQRSWKNIKSTYENGIEKFYKITINNDEIVGFFMLEKIKEEFPYYMDYFAIFKEYQSKGYGTQAIRKLLNDLVAEQGLCIEIEKEDEKEPVTIRRADFYRNLGFKKVESEYLLYKVTYTPYIFTNKDKADKNEIDEIMFSYYKINCGEEAVKNNCEIVY